MARDLSPPLIDVKAAGLTVDGKKLLNELTLQSDARRMAIVGRNGSGKTSFARLICGLVSPTSGQVRVAGVDVAKDRRAALGLVGLLFQNPDHQIIFPTVGEEIGFGLAQMGQGKPQVAQAVDEILALFDRPHWKDANIHQLSQGQRQLVCLMAVLVMEPRLIILDEPFAGLDIPTAAHLRRVLDRLSAHVWQITHDPASAAGYERAVWIDGGCLRREGPATEVLRQYEIEMTRIGERDDLANLAG